MMRIIEKEMESGKVQALPGPGEIFQGFVVCPLSRGFVPWEGRNVRTKGHQLICEYALGVFHGASQSYIIEDCAH